MMRAFLILILVSMISVTTWASLDSNIAEGFRYVLANRWGIATLGDTYYSFFLLYAWIAYKEKSWMRRAIWFVLVCAFGTIAISSYILLQLRNLKPGQSWDAVLTK